MNLFFECLLGIKLKVFKIFFKVEYYSQCGGQGYAGPKKCRTGSCCVLNDLFSQCLSQCPEIAQLPQQALADGINLLKAIFPKQEGFYSICEKDCI